MGRSLLALLVLTGLAGTINDNSLSKKERRYSINLMKDTKEDAVKATKGLSDTQLNWKSSPDKWSVKECMYHIATSEKLLWGMLEQSMNGPATPEKRADVKWTDEQVVQRIEDRTNKVKTAEPFEPKNSMFNSLDEAINDFRQHRMDHIKYLKTTTGDLRNHMVQMPFGTLDCYQLSLMIAAHSNRHTQQMNEVKASSGFPK